MKKITAFRQISLPLKDIKDSPDARYVCLDDIVKILACPNKKTKVTKYTTEIKKITLPNGKSILTKRCSNCGEYIDFSKFYKNRNVCKMCLSKKQKEYAMKRALKREE